MMQPVRSLRHRFLTRTSLIAGAISAVAAPLFGATDAPVAPDLSHATQSVHVPFPKPENFSKLTGMYVRVSLNGGPPMSLMVDTGSVGIIVGASEVPNYDPHAPAGQMAYSSSGIELDGVWSPTTVTFVDSKDADGNPAVAIVPVLAAMSTKSTGLGVNAGKPHPPTTNPHPHMFGIGFGRGKDPHPERNPFMNLKPMIAGTMRRGYTITRDGYTLGLTAGTVGDGYIFQKLKERTVSAETAAIRPGLKDFETSRGWLVVGGQKLPEMPILIDTGLTNFMIPKPGLTGNAELPKGTPVTVKLLDGQLKYSFISGDLGNPTTPRRLTYFLPSTPAANANTGLRALANFDYLYDGDGGYLGLRATTK